MPSLPSLLLPSLLVISILMGASAAGAGSLVSDPLLALVERVHFTVSGGNFDPVPGLDIEKLHREMEIRCEKAFTQAGLEIAKPEDAYFSVTIDHAWNTENGKEVALLVSVDLWIPADPVGFPQDQVAARKRSLSIWSTQRLELSPRVKARETILEALDYALEEFVEARQAAQERLAQ